MKWNFLKNLDNILQDGSTNILDKNVYSFGEYLHNDNDLSLMLYILP